MARQRDPKQWLARYIGLQKVVDAQIAGMLTVALRDIDRRLNAVRDNDSISARVARNRMVSAKAEIMRVLDLLWRDMTVITRANQARAAAAALQMSFDWDETLLIAAFPQSQDREAMRNYLELATSRNVELAIRRVTRDRRTLSARVYGAENISRGYVETAIRNVLARGGSWKDLQDDVRTLVRPDVPGGVSYAAKRLARTELNNAYHAASVEQNSDKPWMEGMEWHLSGSHPTPDECNALNGSVFAPGNVPDKPHPQCLCYVTPKLIDVNTFVNNYTAGVYDSYLGEKFGVRRKEVG